MNDFGDKKCEKCRAIEIACPDCKDYSNFLKYSLRFNIKLMFKRLRKKFKRKPKTCKSCKYSHKLHDEMECRFNPPQIFTANEDRQGRVYPVSAFPVMMISDRFICSKYKKDKHEASS